MELEARRQEPPGKHPLALEDDAPELPLHQSKHETGNGWQEGGHPQDLAERLRELAVPDGFGRRAVERPLEAAVFQQEKENPGQVLSWIHESH